MLKMYVTTESDFAVGGVTVARDSDKWRHLDMTVHRFINFYGSGGDGLCLRLEKGGLGVGVELHGKR